MTKQIEIANELFEVHFRRYGAAVQFYCYPINIGVNLQDNSESKYYTDKKTGQVELIDFSPGTCLSKLDGFYCWRGVWEGRLYFPDNEYWGEEIEVLSKLYNEHLIPFCKSIINPENKNIE